MNTTIVKRIMDFVRPMFQYENKTTLNMNISNKQALNLLIDKISSNISLSIIQSYIVETNNILIIANTEIYNSLYSLLKETGVIIHYVNKSTSIYSRHEYTIHVKDWNKFYEYLTSKNASQIAKRYGVKAYSESLFEVTVEHDHPLENLNKPGCLNIRILNESNPTHNLQKISYKIDPNVLAQMKLINPNMENDYHEIASDPILSHNMINSIIDNITIRKNVLILKLNELAFFQATELYKDNKYIQIAIDIDGYIVAKITLTDIIKQNLQINITEKETLQTVKDLLNNQIYSVRVMNKDKIEDDILYKLMMLILIVIFLIYSIIIKKRKIKYILMSIVFGMLGYYFKYTYIVLLNFITVLLFDYILSYSSYSINLLSNTTYVIISSLYNLIYYNTNYTMNLLPVHHMLYSIILLILSIKA